MIKTVNLDDIREILTEIGVQAMTLGAVTGFGRQQGLTEIYRGAEYAVDFLRKIKLKLLSQISDLNVLSK